MSQITRLTPIERQALIWRKAGASRANGDCVELAPIDGKMRGSEIAMRDSKDPNGPVIVYSPSAFKAFIHRVKTGKFDSLAP